MPCMVIILHWLVRVSLVRSFRITSSHHLPRKVPQYRWDANGKAGIRSKDLQHATSRVVVVIGGFLIIARK